MQVCVHRPPQAHVRGVGVQARACACACACVAIARRSGTRVCVLCVCVCACACIGRRTRTKGARARVHPHRWLVGVRSPEATCIPCVHHDNDLGFDLRKGVIEGPATSRTNSAPPVLAHVGGAGLICEQPVIWDALHVREFCTDCVDAARTIIVSPSTIFLAESNQGTPPHLPVSSIPNARPSCAAFICAGISIPVTKMCEDMWEMWQVTESVLVKSHLTRFFTSSSPQNRNLSFSDPR